MDYVRVLFTYLVEDFMYSGYLLLTMLLPCLIYQGLMEIKVKRNAQRMPAKYYLGVYLLLVYLWAVFKVTGIGLLADIVKSGNVIKGGYNWNPLEGLDMGFVLNVIMFLPLGFLLPCIWKKSRNITSIAITGLGLSLMIEISQIFNWRATDIDDLIANTLGACLGYLIWRGICALICGKRREKEKVQGINQTESDNRKWEPMIYLILAFIGAFFLYNPYVQ